MKRLIHIMMLTLGGIACLATGVAVSTPNHTDQRADAGRHAVTRSPETPTEVTFCGERINLTRYNIRESMDRELSSFTYFHSTTLLLFKRANRYFPIIEPILKANGIPDDFKYLAVIESHLDPSIRSSAGALGMWQFMEATGRSYGLTITPTADERCHVAKATAAACRYLKDAYAKYGDWVSVAMSYNGGMGRISNEYVRQGVASALDLWLVEETTRYPYRIFAIKLIFEQPQRYGFIITPRDLYKPIACDEVTVSDIPDLIGFAKKHNITYADLRRFNPWLRDSKLNAGGRQFTIAIPRREELYYDTPNSIVHDPRWVTNR